MARITAVAFAALACVASASLAAPEPAKPGTPPPASSHAPVVQEKKAAEPKHDAKKPVAKAAAPAKTPWVSEWRKAYIAKNGHAPGASEKAPPKKAAAKTLPKYKRCT
jgi:hypothetical protein